MCSEDEYDYDSDYDSDYEDSDYDSDYDESDESVEEVDDATDEIEESPGTVEEYELQDGDESVEEVDDATDEIEESPETVEEYELQDGDESIEEIDDATDEIEESPETVEEYELQDGDEPVEVNDNATEDVEGRADSHADQVHLDEGEVPNSESLSQSSKSTIDGGANSDLDTINDTISNAIEELFANESAEYIKVLEERLEHADLDVMEMVEGNLDLIEIADTFYMGAAHFNPNNGEIYLNSNLDEVNPRGAGATFYHEAAHAIDIQNNEASLNGEFEAAIRSDVENYIDTYAEEHSLSREEAIDEISMTVLAGHSNHSISDIFGGVTGGECQGDYGHMPEYWDNYGMLAKETFAHFTEAAIGCPEKYEKLSTILPTAFAEYKSIVEGLKK